MLTLYNTHSTSICSDPSRIDSKESHATGTDHYSPKLFKHRLLLFMLLALRFISFHFRCPAARLPAYQNIDIRVVFHWESNASVPVKTGGKNWERYIGGGAGAVTCYKRGMHTPVQGGCVVGNGQVRV